MCLHSCRHTPAPSLSGAHLIALDLQRRREEKQRAGGLHSCRACLAATTINHHNPLFFSVLEAPCSKHCPGDRRSS